MRWPFLGTPLIKRELVGLLRTKRAYWLVVVSAVLSSIVPIVCWAVVHDTGGGGGGEMVAIFSLNFMVVQLLAALLMIPAFSAGAISTERERKTLEPLYCTQLSPFTIVGAKLISTAGYMLLLLVISAPMASMLYLLGGVEFRSIGIAYVVTITALIYSTVVCLTVSMRSRRTSHAVVRSVLWLVFWNAGLALLYGFGMEFLFDSWDGSSLDDHDLCMNLLFGLSPFVAVSADFIQSFGANFPAGLLLPPWLAYVSLTTLLTLLHLTYLLFRVRLPDPPSAYRRSRALPPTDGAVVAGSPPLLRRKKRRLTLTTHALLALGSLGIPGLSNPVFQREIRFEFFSQRWFRRAFFWVPLLLFGAIALIGDDVSERTLPICIIALVLMILVVPAIIAGSLPRERELGSFNLLRTALLPMPQVAIGKLLAGLWSCAGFLVATCSVVVLCCVFSDPRQIWSGGGQRSLPAIYALPFRILPLVLTYAFVALVAFLASTLFRRTIGALLITYGTLIAVFLIIPLLLTLIIITGRADPTALWLANPFFITCIGLGWEEHEIAYLVVFTVILTLACIGLAWVAIVRANVHSRER